MKKASKKLRGVRMPTAKGTIWHKDKSKYERQQKHKEDYEDESNVER